MDLNIKQKKYYQHLASNVLCTVTPEKALWASSLIQVKALLRLITTAGYWELKNIKQINKPD